MQESPRSWTERAIRECDGAHALFTDGVEQLAHTMKGASGPVPASAVSLFSAAAEDAVRAFAEHRIWLESDLSHKAHERYACGAEAFDLYMKEGHCLDESAEEVLLYAEDQLAQAETYGAQHCSDFAASNASEVTGRLGDIAPSASEYYDRYGVTSGPCRTRRDWSPGPTSRSDTSQGRSGSDQPLLTSTSSSIDHLLRSTVRRRTSTWSRHFRKSSKRISCERTMTVSSVATM